MGGTIVCGVTESAEAGSAAQLAGALAARLGLRLVLVHVVDGLPRSAFGSAAAREREAAGERLLETLGEDSPVDVETRLVLGDAVHGLANVAAEEGADLVVVGARSGGPRNRRLVPRLARELPAATPVPVVVAPPSTRKRSDQRLGAPV
ncbi:MAG TPA: universal stress protein [Gaiellaceae bacterium]|nr:universal stress protein [Gaiellaceae bacterium]